VEDLSDNEREEQLRNWWSENWLWIVGGIALGLAGLAGYQYWQQTRYQAAESAEASYLALLDSLASDQRDAAVKQADELRKQHPKSPYADQADLALARAAVGRRDFDDAARRLRTVADASRDEQLRQVARSRLARVLIEQGKHDEALALLDVAKAGAFAALFHDVRGDAMAAKGDAAAAAREYDAALAAASTAAQSPATALGATAVIDSAYIELKREALAVPAAASTPAAATTAPVPAAVPAAATTAPATVTKP
jgi:predicted negative regulator of RcsB-dependent stress response